MSKSKHPRFARKPSQENAPSSPETGGTRWREIQGWRAIALLAVFVLIFYWIPLTDPATSIQWDAVDVHYSSQKYFADHLVSGVLPFWTPYIYSGFPFLADIQVGAWYPLNWPFFLVGITPRIIQLEIAVHAFLACAGAFLLLQIFTRNRWAALIGAMLYGFTGYFADHSSHVGMFCAASLMPWLLFFFHRALERSTVRFAVLAGLTGGAILLTGHFQAALYSFAALTLFAASSLILQRQFVRTVSILAGIAVLSLGISAIVILPGMELTKLSIRNRLDYSNSNERVLRPVSLMNVILPQGVDLVRKQQPAAPPPAQEDVNYYLYSGILLLPLAAFGLRNRKVLLPALLLAIPTIWYMLGPDAGFYRLAVLLPGLHKVRAPIHMWFVPALGLAVLATAGLVQIAERASRWWILPLAAVVIFTDLFWCNSLTNTHAYARAPFAEIYGNHEQLAAQMIMPMLPQQTRYDEPDRVTVFGSLNHPLDLKMETTYGYNPLELQSYAEYMSAMNRNPKLRAGLNISYYMVVEKKAALAVPDVLPRAYFARSIISAKDSADSLRRLESLDPAQATIVTGAPGDVQAPPEATVAITRYDEQEYHMHYKSPAKSLLKLSVPWYPGWQATTGDQSCQIVPADHALMGIVVPPGEHDLVVRFKSSYFGTGLIISLVFAAAALAALLRARTAKDPQPAI